MNRADVTVQVQPDRPDRSKIVFTATAQEGLISQDTAAKAISRLLEAVQ
jgi:ribosomal protein S20